MTDEHDPDRPWVPEGLAAKLVVGARVRWRKNPECDWECPGCGEDMHGHYPDTGTGTITQISKTLPIAHLREGGCNKVSTHQGHAYSVEGDEALPHSFLERKEHFWAAAIELVPLEEPQEGGEA